MLLYRVMLVIDLAALLQENSLSWKAERYLMRDPTTFGFFPEVKHLNRMADILTVFNKYFLPPHDLLELQNRTDERASESFFVALLVIC
jgi:hypothetical protein